MDFEQAEAYLEDRKRESDKLDAAFEQSLLKTPQLTDLQKQLLMELHMRSQEALVRLSLAITYHGYMKAQPAEFGPWLADYVRKGFPSVDDRD